MLCTVAEGSDDTPTTTNGDRPPPRPAPGSAVSALNAFSSDFSADARREHGFHEPQEAMQALAASVDEGTLGIPRLFVLDSLVKLAGRRAESLTDHEEELDDLLGALVRDAGVPEPEVGESVATLRGALDSVAQLTDIRVGSRWATFSEKAAGTLLLTKAEREKPLCTDIDNVPKGKHKAVGVTVEFHTDASPGDLRHFCDPTRWHEFSAQQREMKPWDHPDAVDEQQPNGRGWRRDLVETVDLSPSMTLQTPLRFTHTIDDEGDPRWVHLDYVLPEETEHIVVDEGALDVRRVPAGEHQGHTRVLAKKVILFADPLLRTWPTLACDTFWTEMVIAAAVGCSDDDVTSPTRGRNRDGRHAGRPAGPSDR
jgi:hypothetical protein